MNIPDLVKWAKTIKSQTREERLNYHPKYLPKIDAYIQMIIDRGDIIQTQTIRMNRFMEEIQEGLTRLQGMGLESPGTKKEVKPTSENPLKP